MIILYTYTLFKLLTYTVLIRRRHCTENYQIVHTYNISLTRGMFETKLINYEHDVIRDYYESNGVKRICTRFDEFPFPILYT